jgi:hypothetical protein
MTFDCRQNHQKMVNFRTHWRRRRMNFRNQTHWTRRVNFLNRWMKNLSQYLDYL